MTTPRGNSLTLPLQVRLSPAMRDALGELAEREGGLSLSTMARVLIVQGLIRRRPRPRSPVPAAIDPKILAANMREPPSDENVPGIAS